jgi:hypothetical protein
VTTASPQEVDPIEIKSAPVLAGFAGVYERHYEAVFRTARHQALSLMELVTRGYWLWRGASIRALYNALVPFFVAVLEHFCRTSFEILVKFDSQALQKLEAQNRRVAFEDAVAIARGDFGPERMAASWYSFQNIDSTHKAFSEVLGIDLWGLLRRRREYGRSFRGLPMHSAIW